MSRIFKAAHYLQSEEKVLLSTKAYLPPKTVEESERLQENEKFLQDAELEAQAILRDAEEMAKKILQEAEIERERQKQQVTEELQQWIAEQQEETERLKQQERKLAHQEGFMQGMQDGREHVIAEERETIEAAREVLELAHQQKKRIIGEAEPFLIELATEIARKIIGDELQVSPEKKREMLGRVLRRSRVHGEITLCVSHRDYAFIEEHRQQLVALLDGQVELMIVPDITVTDEGCVIRTSLGSIDARIDTQLSEIKQALLEIARGSDTDEPS